MAKYTFESHQPLKEMAIAAVRMEDITQFPADVSIAFGASESDWFTKVTGRYNYWGITRAPEKGPASMCQTMEIITPAQLAEFREDERSTATVVKGRDGQPLKYGSNAEKLKYSMKRWFADYATPDESMRSFVSLFTGTSRYRPTWQNFLQHGDAEKLCAGICQAGYATDPNSYNLKLTIMRQQNVRDAVEKARAANASIKVVS